MVREKKKKMYTFSVPLVFLLGWTYLQNLFILEAQKHVSFDTETY